MNLNTDNTLMNSVNSANVETGASAGAAFFNDVPYASTSADATTSATGELIQLVPPARDPDVIKDGKQGYILDTPPTITGPAAGGTVGLDALTNLVDIDGDYDVDLSNFYLTLPYDTDADTDTEADTVSTTDLVAGWTDGETFLQNNDGSLTFNTTADTTATTENSSYVRTELRELLNPSNSSNTDISNNWVIDTTSTARQEAAGGVNGGMSATLRVDRVTTDGDSTEQIGRVMIGQIHGAGDEPIRMYFHKAADSDTASIYFASETSGGEFEYWIPLVSDSEEWLDGQGGTTGIELGEVFGYDITMDGSVLTAVITKEDGSTFTQEVDMSNTGFDSESEYLYFKAGLYSGNKSDIDRTTNYESATFYEIEKEHGTAAAPLEW